MQDDLIDTLELDYGTAILSELVGEPLTRKGQSVRLFDESKRSAESFGIDGRGKPYIKNHQSGECWYPVTAYRQAYDLDYKTACAYLCQQFSMDNNGIVQQLTRKVSTKPVVAQRPIDYLPINAYAGSQTHFERNGLYEYLRFTFGFEAAQDTFTRYRLGTSRRWRYLGYLATSLPQFDVNGNLRQVKIIPLNATDGRRIKAGQDCEKWNYKTGQYEPTELDTDKTYFAGKQLAKAAGIANPNLVQTFFGSHLLTKHPTQTVAITEAESTAIIASIYFPSFCWIATGGKNGVRWTDPETFSVLKGRDVVLWPDVDAHDEWSQKAQPLRSLVRSLSITDYVKANVPASMLKADLRDLLTRPYYLPTDTNQPIYGEALAYEVPDEYPTDWN